MGGKKRRSEAEKPGGSGISRRKFVAGSLFLVGGSSMLVDGETTASFRDSLSASGTVAVDGDPTLNYQIQDESKNNNAEYQIAFQVKWVSNFDRIEVEVENIDNPNISGDTFTRAELEGTISYPRDGGSDGGAMGERYQFTFRVYRQGTNDPIITKQTTDEAGGSGSSSGEFGNTNSPQLDWVLVEDTTKNNNGEYTAYYEVSNLDSFGQVRARFRDTNNSAATNTDLSQDSPTGSLSYNEGGTEGDSFEITIEVENQSGLVVDDVVINDDADGSDPSGYGDPTRPDSPKLESFTLTDTTQNNTTNYTVSYETSNTDRFGGARVTFEDTQKESATEIKTTGSNEPNGTVEYSSGGTEDHRFEVTVEILETRNGTTFAIDSGTLEDTADGGATMKWPEDAN
ncbi:hypothetical protein SAMN05216559_2078 [Halomicrobium zhouii]|uniref:Uncharacterized protein n=1 Tax=Halomicrobium zhouii TaxID=767519 RepID=A0A1I6L5G1_9EURY|nr:hypothetical protein [Halomicrobium zhouii]SFR98676.1 hypothetical protein SAMN05216559_2078 [Halomicrobium zhouii]